MKNKVHIPKTFNIRITKCEGDIEKLQIVNENAKKQIIVVLKQNNGGTFIPVAEYYLELLLHTEKIVEVLRHDLREILSEASQLVSQEQLEVLMKKLRIIDQDLLKTSKVVKNVLAAIANQ